jgi:hypothetical protein
VRALTATSTFFPAVVLHSLGHPGYFVLDVAFTGYIKGLDKGRFVKKSAILHIKIL